MINKRIGYRFFRSFIIHGNHVRFFSNGEKSYTDRLTQAMEKLNRYRAEEKEKSANKEEMYQPRHNYSGYLKKSTWMYFKDKINNKKSEPINYSQNDRKNIFWKNHCLLMGYSGDNYCGMQYNPNVPTIENELFNAMHKHDWITQENKEKPWTIQFQRGSRTDRGVSAVRQVCSLWLPFEIDVEALNNDLPKDIRVFGAQRVTKKFDSRFQCNARTYSYTLPTVAFGHYNEQSNMKEYRVPSDRMELAQSIFNNFNGQTNFHNYTVDKQYFDRSSTRNIEYIKCVEPFVCDDVEFTRIEIKGQSFMLHQIRKMMGFSLAVIRGIVPQSMLKESLTKKKFSVPTAPGLGLVLERLHFDKYNRLFGDLYGNLSFDNYETEIEEFRKKYINPTIIRTEIEEESMVSWMDFLVNHNYEHVDENTLNDQFDDSWGEDPELWKKVEDRFK